MLSYTSINPSIDVFKPYLMDSDLIYPTLSPEAVTVVNAFKIPFLKRFQSHEVYETDDKASPGQGRQGYTQK
jgi:hypothetical protein